MNTSTLTGNLIKVRLTKNYHDYEMPKRSFFVLKYSHGNATYARYLKVFYICNSFTLIFQVINLYFIQGKF